MIKTFDDSNMGSLFAIATEFPAELIYDRQPLMFIWNDGEAPVTIHLDDRETELLPSSVLCTTYMYNLRIDNSDESLKILLFNREFYCIHTNDTEVSCNGLLFFGSDVAPVLQLNKEESNTLHTLFRVLSEEFDISDTGQEEMLRILLKRFIIRCTRLANRQIVKNGDNQTDIDLIRHYNVLVEEHFKSKKRVSDYAELLYKSPKTIANVFSKNSEYTPLEVIHNRVILEAKRMLLYTDKPAKQISDELGYNDPAQFSKLFKKQTAMTTSEFKKSKSTIPV
ncbi:MAG: helix-turn-helix domain-containing protein [Balneolaceae bacterium]